jgi:hypothetical protein
MIRTLSTATLALLLTVAPATAQMMNPGQHMMQQQQAAQQQQYNPYGMHPSMMGGYGYGMGPQMMGGYGYGMHHGMMGGYGYGMPHMMGGWAGHHPMHHMGGWGMPPCTQGPQYMTSEQYTRFMDETRDERRRLHDLMFDYGEAMRNPEPDREKLQAMQKEIEDLRNKIFSHKIK